MSSARFRGPAPVQLDERHEMVGMTGLEPAHSASQADRLPLPHNPRKVEVCRRIELRSRLYESRTSPTTLADRNGAEDGSRTHVRGLQNHRSTVELPRRKWWFRQDSNLQPLPHLGRALAVHKAASLPLSYGTIKVVDTHSHKGYCCPP